MPSKQEVDAILSEPVCIVGAGPTGLITAHTLLQDGFTNIQIFTKDDEVGGVWSKKRIYPGLVINNAHGEFNFSSLPMPAPTRYDERLTGEEVSAYMEVFAQMYVKDKIQFGVEVVNLRRVDDEEKSRWVVKLLHTKTGIQEEKVFRRVILCTGGCSTPTIPPDILPSVAESAGFSGLIFHTSDWKERLDQVLQVVGPRGSGTAADKYAGNVVIVGGGRSAQDIATYLANQGREVTMVFGKANGFIATVSPMPPWLRKSRLLSLFSPHIELRSRTERFLHTTWVGSIIVRLIWTILTALSFEIAGVPANSPLRNAYEFFWDTRVTDEGVPDSEGFHAAVNAGKIELVTPARVTGYYEGGVLVRGDDPSDTEPETQLRASVVIMATGYGSSWDHLFDAQTMSELGLAQEPYNPQNKFSREWDRYRSLANPPLLQPEAQKYISLIHRGIVPAKNILRRDLAINGAAFSGNYLHTCEVAAHWISSYFLQDPMKLPSTVEEALAQTHRHAAWFKKRYPNASLNPSYGSVIPYLTWPQAMDELLEDMYLPSGRSGGNWLTWPFRVIDLQHIANLSEERRRLRQAASLST